MPLLRHSLAAGNCRYVGIASPLINTHTRSMFKRPKNFFITLAGILATLFALGTAALNNPELDSAAQTVHDGVDNKHILVSQAQRWVADTRQVQKSAVEVTPSDRRLMVPTCNNPFEFNFPFATSQKTLRATCPENGWQVFLGINIHQTRAALRYTGDFTSGHQLRSTDVETVKLSKSIAGLASDALAIESFSLTTAVRAGDLVMQRQLSTSVEGYKLIRSVVAGDVLDISVVEIVMLASANLPASQRLSIEKLDGARAARALASGTVLSSYDIKEKQQVLITQSGIARGQAVARADVALQDYYGKLPKDSLRDYSSAAQMQAIRNLAAGVPLRLSDLAPVNVIRKGDNVQLSIRKGALEITVTMLSLGNARSGQRILLLNPESGEKIQALAEGPGRARGLTSSAKMPDRQGLLRSNK